MTASHRRRDGLRGIPGTECDDTGFFEDYDEYRDVTRERRSGLALLFRRAATMPDWMLLACAPYLDLSVAGIVARRGER